MKILCKSYTILLIATLLLSFYSWYYNHFLYERFYVTYLNKYRIEKPVPLYDIKGKIDNGTVADNFSCYLPIYAKIMYNTMIISIIAIPTLYILSFLAFLIILIFEKRIVNIKWWLVQLAFFAIIFVLWKTAELIN
jgi:hypothetical protein